MTDAELAAHLAATAGRILLEVRASGVFEGKALGKAGDQVANQFLVHALRQQRPDDGLLSEEEKDNPERQGKSRVWIVDPVDGTREYGEERSDWAVHVGMAVDGVATLGAVALPGLGEGAVFRSDVPVALPEHRGVPRLLVSRTRPAAEALAELGVDVIEAGFPATSAGERESMRKIAAMKLNSRICGLARCNKADVDAALDCNVDYVHVFIATSDLHLTHKLRMTRDQVKAKAIEAIEYAKSHGLTVEFSCEDGTRTDLPFLKEMHQAVQQAGVDKINLPDTVGTMSPPAMEMLVKELMTVTKVPLSIHCHNDFGLAVANSLAAVRQGARQVHVCVNGMGERCGNASLEEIVMGLTAFYGAGTNVAINRIGYTSKLVSRLTGIPIPDNKPVVGGHAFAHESGIHVHGVLKNPRHLRGLQP